MVKLKSQFADKGWGAESTAYHNLHRINFVECVDVPDYLPDLHPTKNSTYQLKKGRWRVPTGRIAQKYPNMDTRLATYIVRAVVSIANHYWSLFNPVEGVEPVEKLASNQKGQSRLGTMNWWLKTWPRLRCSCRMLEGQPSRQEERKRWVLSQK